VIISWFWANWLSKWSPYHNNIHNFVIRYYQGFFSNGWFLPWPMTKTSFSQQTFLKDLWVSWSLETNFMLHACLKWFKWSKFKNRKECKKPKERLLMLSKWSEGLEKKCVGGWLGLHHIFLRWSFSNPWI